MSNKTQLQTNNIELNSLIETLRGKAAGGTTLPTLTNPGDATNLLNGKELIGADGTVVTGSMPDNGTTALAINALTQTSVSVPAGYTSGGSVTLTSDLANEVSEQDDLLDQVIAALEGKAAGSGGSGGTTVETCTVNFKPIGFPATDVTYSTLDENGKITSINSGICTPVGKTLENVVCGTLLYFGLTAYYIDVSGAECLHYDSDYVMLKVLGADGETVDIIVTGDIGT